MFLSVDVAYSCDVIVLAVKPQYLDDVLSGLGSKLRVDTLYVSILAGITICSLTEVNVVDHFFFFFPINIKHTIFVTLNTIITHLTHRFYIVVIKSKCTLGLVSLLGVRVLLIYSTFCNQKKEILAYIQLWYQETLDLLYKSDFQVSHTSVYK